LEGLDLYLEGLSPQKTPPRGDGTAATPKLVCQKNLRQWLSCKTTRALYANVPT